MEGITKHKITKLPLLLSVKFSRFISRGLKVPRIKLKKQFGEVRVPTVCPSIAARWRPKTSCNWVKCWMKATTSAWKRWVCTYCTEAICRLTRMSCSLRSRGSGRPYLGTKAKTWLWQQQGTSRYLKKTCLDLGFSLEKSFSSSMEIHIKFHKANSNNYCLSNRMLNTSLVIAGAINR